MFASLQSAVAVDGLFLEEGRIEAPINVLILKNDSITKHCCSCVTNKRTFFCFWGECQSSLAWSTPLVPLPVRVGHHLPLRPLSRPVFADILCFLTFLIRSLGSSCLGSNQRALSGQWKGSWSLSFRLRPSVVEGKLVPLYTLELNCLAGS